MNSKKQVLETIGGGAAANKSKRLAYLDGLRGLAILAVLAYHYYSRFANEAKPMYPYGSVWSDFSPFQYGYYGVHLFFAISGFVIALSLERCRTLDEFVIRRFARLWPTMLLCSVLTYTILTLWPRFWPQSPGNFLPSLTFIDGQVWNRLMPDLQAQWIDGAYWSLFVEVRFYALAALIYFFSPRRFVITLATFSALVVTAHVILRLAGKAYWADLLQMAFIANYLPWFMVGIAALLNDRKRFRAAWSLVAMAGLSLVLLVIAGERKADMAVFGLVVFLLFAPRKSDLLSRVLAHPALVGIGIASYSLYLLHQNAGLTLISVIAKFLGLTSAAALPVSVAVGVAIVGISQIIFHYWEIPLNRMIVNAYFKVRPKVAPQLA